MSIRIGDRNKIENSTIAEKIDGMEVDYKKKSFYERHPVICSILISLGVGIVLLFSFWQEIISIIEGLFNG